MAGCLGCRGSAPQAPAKDGSAGGGAGGDSPGTGGSANLGTGGTSVGSSGGANGSSGGANGSSGGANGSAGGANGSAGGANGRSDGGTSEGGVPDGGGPDGGPPQVGPTPSTVTRQQCTGSAPIECHFGGAPGNYDVTVILGGAAAGNTSVQAEALRTMLAPVVTAAGETRRFTFTVNVREPEGEPVQVVPPGTPGLDLYFLGNGGLAPQLQAIGYAAAPAAPTIWIGGDSTACDQSAPAYSGWGQQLPQFFNYPISVANYADSGESSGSFLGNIRLFGAIEDGLKPNDWVLLQFGVDEKNTLMAVFHDNLTMMVDRVRAKGASPILVTPGARAQFSGNTVLPQHIQGTVDLPAVIRQVAAERGIPVLDMTARTVQWLTQLGPGGWSPYFANGTDQTHTNPAGAQVVAGFVRDLIVQSTGLTSLASCAR